MLHAIPKRIRVTYVAILCLPMMCFTALLLVYPVYSVIKTAFQDNTLTSLEVSFNGLNNFVNLFHDDNFLPAVWFTLFYTVVVVAIEMILGIALALAMERKLPGHRVLFTAILLPLMIAPALLAIMFRLILNHDIGLIPALAKAMGFDISLLNPQTIVPLLITLDVVEWMPFVFLIIYAALQSFPRELREAAAVDGAGAWMTLWHVLLPVLKPVIFAAVFLRTMEAMRTFDMIYVLTGGGPGTKTTNMSIFIYKAAFDNGNTGLAAAASLLVLVVLLPFVPWIVKRLTAGATG